MALVIFKEGLWKPQHDALSTARTESPAELQGSLECGLYSGQPCAQLNSGSFVTVEEGGE